jgi:carbonic anhydrase/acetyltransferase-like protein (isoleucine patch superfamily)
MPLLPYLGTMPTVADDLDLDAEGFVIGKVRVAEGVRIGRRTVLRGDQNRIEIGPRCRFGAEATLHVDPDKPCILGADVVVEDRAVVHGCVVGEAVLVEAGATVLSGSRVGEGSIVQAGALVGEGKEIPPRSVVAGTPGRVVRQTSDDEVAEIRRRAAGA